jgi:hypothetical protein
MPSTAAATPTDAPDAADTATTSVGTGSLPSDIR